MIEQQVKPVQQVQQANRHKHSKCNTSSKKSGARKPINEQQVTTVSTKCTARADSAVQKVQPIQTENYQNSEASTIQQAQLSVPAGYDRILSMWTYLGMLIVSWIPLIGFIATIAWAVKKGNKNKRRFAAAMLILQIIGIAAGIFVYPATISLLKTVLKGLNTGIG